MSSSTTNESSSSFFSLSSSWFRSEPMEYVSIVMNEDAAYECLVKVGKLGAIQFTDVSACTLYFVGTRDRASDVFIFLESNFHFLPRSLAPNCHLVVEF